MLKLGQLMGLLITEALMGVGSPWVLKKLNIEMMELAIEARKSGVVSIKGFHQRLVDGK